jgi:putative flippase GtrA
MRSLIAQLARFGAVGAVGLVVDVAIFNALRITVLSPDDVASGPFWAKVISTSVAIVVNWIGNRYWTFGAQRQSKAAREGLEFAVVSVGGMLIGLLCLWVSREVLGYTSLLADNIASNVVGLALGTVFRFTLYRAWVFNPKRVARLSTLGVHTSGAGSDSTTGEVPASPVSTSPSSTSPGVSSTSATSHGASSSKTTSANTSTRSPV